MLYEAGREEFDEIFRIMKDSFPEDERRPYAEQKAVLDNKGYRLYTCKENKSADIEGFIGLWEFCHLIFIEHIAVDGMHRGKGIGSEMLKEIIGKCEKPQNSRTYTGIVLEVELPQNPIAVSRIRFYERHGFFLNEYDYVQPPMCKGMDPLPLYIMSYGRELTEEEFHIIKDLLYKKVYNQ